MLSVVLAVCCVTTSVAAATSTRYSPLARTVGSIVPRSPLGVPVPRATTLAVPAGRRVRLTVHDAISWPAGGVIAAWIGTGAVTTAPGAGEVAAATVGGGAPAAAAVQVT